MSEAVQYLVLKEQPDGSFLVHKPAPSTGPFLAVPDDEGAWEPFGKQKKEPKSEPAAEES